MGLSPTPQLWEVPTMVRSISLVGLDVHAAQTHAAILDTGTGELRGVKLRMPPLEVVEFLAGLPGPGSDRARDRCAGGCGGKGAARVGGPDQD